MPLQDSSEHIGLWIVVLRWQFVFIILWQLVFPQTVAYLHFVFFWMATCVHFFVPTKETCIVLFSFVL
jgi:hypothetical protein